MPTYEYICKTCGDRLEIYQPFNAKALRRHDDCGGDLKKVFHARGVVFKGSGFYVTDSRSQAKSATATSAPASTGAEGDSSVSDAAKD